MTTDREMIPARKGNQINMGKKIRRHHRDDGIVTIIIGGAAAIMVIIIVAAFMIVSGKGDDTSKDQTQTGDATDTVISGDTTDMTPLDTSVGTTKDTEASSETEADTTEKESESTPPDVPIVYNEELLNKVSLKKAETPAGYRDKLVFFGDSTTYGMKAYKVFGSRDTKQVWTPKSGTLALWRALTDLIYNPNTGEEQLLGDLCASVKPEYLIMTLGVNGIAFLDEESFKEEYQNVIDTIRKNSPDTHLILQSIYPVASNSETLGSINNTRIQAANQWIVELAAKNSLPYLNTYSALVGSDGWLPLNYQNGDGMHFNEVGFKAIMDYVLAHPYIP